MSIRFPRGAEWRVWDLQVHTPYSELNNGFGSDFEEYAKKFFLKAIEKGVAVVGVTDYFLVDGYKHLKEIQGDDSLLTKLIGPENIAAAKSIVLFANVELRTEVLIDGNRVNYHVVFSNEVTAEDITENFLAQLKFTSEGVPGGLDQKLALTRKNLEDFGKKIKKHHSNFEGMSDLFVGMMQASVDHKDLMTVLGQQEEKFGGKYVFCVPCDEDLSKVSWNGQGHMTRKLLIQKSHMLFTSNAQTREFALGLKHATPDDYLQEFRSFKPCVHGSDAHNFKELFNPALDRLTWIKADPTFNGLYQTLNEPDSRVYIGPTPPGLVAVRNRPTKIVRELSIHKKTGSSLSEKWFDLQLPLNAELVAIIGNKGSGKSALADILGLIGNTPRHNSFSFLSPNRFKDRKNNKAKHFEASATWADDKVDGPVSLEDSPQPSAIETIKYIPQDYLETICNEVSLGSGSQFYAELQNVIFSHVPEAEQMGHPSLDDLLAHRSEETKKSIGFLIDQLKVINREIISREEQITDTHRKGLEAQQVAKQREIDAHELAKPPLQAPPSEDPAAAELASKVGEQMQLLQLKLVDIDAKIATAKTQLAETTRRRTTAERLLGKLSNVERQLKAASAEAQAEIAELGLKWVDLVRHEISKNPVQEIIQSATTSAAEQTRLLDVNSKDSLAFEQLEVKREISALTAQLSAKQKEYEDYKAALKGWDEQRTLLIGTPEQIGSLSQIKALIANLPTIRDQLVSLRRDRSKKTKEIYTEKEHLRNDYGRYYGAVQQFLAQHQIAKSQQFKLTFNVAISDQGFSTGFLNLLNRRRAGSFAGLEEGAERLKQFIDGTNFDSSEELLKFLIKVMKALREDQRQGTDPTAMDLKSQLAQGASVADVYDYLFSLNFLEPVYSLKWDGKTLEQLSPGERGNLLLIFYLLIDRDDIPLVIDQPEENLDNHTVYRTLVPCVKEAKTRRQIIMVTHNPNLAVVCDADQVICAEIRKDNGNEVRYVSGSIEDPLINRRIVDILEGTRPAFDKRDAKYQDRE